MKIIIFISIVTVLSGTLIDTTTPCTCVQLSQNDCQKNTGCTWSKTCIVKQTTISLIPTYCSQFTDVTCNQEQACLWIKGNCIPFTGCSAYALTTDNECNSISKRCYKSDQTKCIEQGQCEDYQKESVCIMNIDNRFCYWDSVASSCKLADQCSNQPTYADTDEKCRAQLSTCTTIPGGGCKEANDNCSDVKLEIQCYYNKYKTSQCFWDSSVNPPLCKEKNCNNAPTSYTMDKQCISFIPTCTTKLNGGCTLRAGCEVAQVKAACVTDSNGGECFWVDGSCKQKLCNNATKLIVTNIGCQSISSQCITKSGGGCMQNGECSVANVDYACKTNIRGEQCFWDVISNTCKDRTCINAPITYTTNEQCTKYLQSCTINSKKAGCEDRSCANAPVSIQTTQGCQDFFNDTCITKKGGGCVTKNECADIDLEISCLTDKEGRICYWNNDLCQLKICENVPKKTINAETQEEQQITLTHDLCQQFMSTCTINQTGDNCVEYICSNVNDESACTNNQSCFWRQNCFVQSCYTAPLSYTTHSQCFSYFTNCTISQSGQGCAVMMKTCNQYKTHIQCIQSVASQCEWSNEQCVQRTCLTADTSLTTTSQCASYLSGCVVNNSQAGCMSTITKCSDSQVEENCKLSMCYWSNNVCNTRLCGSQTYDCVNIHAATKCINNESKTQCIVVPSKCSDLPTEYCEPSLSYDLISKYCYINTTCVDFTLQTNCSSYLVQNQCITRSNNQGKCVWYNGTCYNSVCSALPNDLNNTSKCKAVITTCIVDNDATGCREIGECTSYSSSNCDQLDSSGRICAIKDGTCQLKSCATASAINHTDCFNYILTGTRCTVNSTANGCIALSLCSSYSVNAQCTINQNQQPCYWNSTTNKCVDKTCELETTSTTHDQCQSFMTSCTLNTTTNLGCIQLPVCSLISDQIICNSNTKCMYVNNNCVTKTCSNAIVDSYSVSTCNTLPFTNCQYDSQFCSTKTCNYYVYQTDDQCKTQNPACTTDGIQCVERLQCSDAKTEQGCVTDIIGNLCQWTNSGCSPRSCGTAPTTLQTEAQCKEYYPGCTTKSGGGCAVKSTCAAATAQLACTQSVSGDICHWDESLSMCRNQSCIDFIGNTYQACQKFGQTCTTDGISKCLDISTCNTYGNALSCIVGLDGPCLWINQKCYAYVGCTSIKLTTHSDCQSVSTKCTTDGTQCVPITECRLSNLNGGCIIGIDGDCIILTTTDTNTKKCALFSSCSDATYTTHADCNNANKSCTTDTTHCISLSTCKEYKLEQQCYLDSQGVQYINNTTQVKQTGVCKWEQSACRAQICEDLIGVTHSICNTQMYTCTSDGKQCITMAKCTGYTTQDQCTNALGSDGTCFYTKENTCRLKTCTDLTTDCTQLSICVSDGTKCVSKNTCAAYETSTACGNPGTDGLCIWNNTKLSCLLFSSCSVADTQINCNKMPTLCYWSSDLKCTSMTCAQQFKQSGICSYLNTWTSNQINTCVLTNGVCSESDPTSLPASDCYKLSGYTYTFNTSTSKCLKCGQITDTNSTTNNSNNETNQTQTSSFQILRMIITIVILVL